MVTLSLDQAIQQAKSYLEEDQLEDARDLYHAVLQKFPKNERVHKDLAVLQNPLKTFLKEPPTELIKQLIELYNQDQLVSVAEKTLMLTLEFPGSAAIWNMLAVVNKKLGRNKVSEVGFKNVITLRPNYLAGYIRLGIVLKEQGKHDEAIKVYDKVLSIKSDYSEAFNSRGNILKEQGKLNEAIQEYRKAISLETNFVEAYNNLGLALIAQGRLKEAIKEFRIAISFQSDFSECHYNLGCALHQQGKLREAIEAYEKASHHGLVRAADTFHRKGNALRDLGRFEEALQAYKEAVSLKPDFAECYFCIGNTLMDLGKLGKSIWAYRKAILIKPDFAEAYHNMGNALQNQDRIKSALTAYGKAVSIKPNFVEAYKNMGNAYYNLAQLDKALEAYNKVLSLKPDSSDSYNNIGLTFLERGMFDEAEKAFKKALLLDSNSAKVYYNLSLFHNIQGNLKLGFELYEWRSRLEGKNIGSFKKEGRLQRNQSVNRKHILIHEEQGLGDTIQFCRYLPLLEKNGATVSFKVTPTLHKLLSTLEGSVSIISDAPEKGRFDYETSLLSLPHFFGTQLSTIPSESPYLHADNLKIRSWKKKLKKNSFKIGICWQGNTGKVDVGRSFPVVLFEAISKISNIELLSLHKGEGEDQLLNAGFPITTFGEDFDAGQDAFADTAAVMILSDLIITSDTAVAHLAGALGCKTWVALKYLPDWRWLMDRRDSPWYPTLSLYRQDEPGNWESVFKNFEHNIRLLVERGQ